MHTNFNAVTLQSWRWIFKLLGEVTEIEPIAVNLSIRERKSLKSRFGGRRSLAEAQRRGVGPVPQR